MRKFSSIISVRRWIPYGPGKHPCTMQRDRQTAQRESDTETRGSAIQNGACNMWWSSQQADDERRNVWENTVFAQMLTKLSRTKTYQEMRETAYDILATLEDMFYTPRDGRNKKCRQLRNLFSKTIQIQIWGRPHSRKSFESAPFIYRGFLRRIWVWASWIIFIEFVSMQPGNSWSVQIWRLTMLRRRRIF